MLDLATLQQLESPRLHMIRDAEAVVEGCQPVNVHQDGHFEFRSQSLVFVTVRCGEKRLGVLLCILLFLQVARLRLRQHVQEGDSVVEDAVNESVLFFLGQLLEWQARAILDVLSDFPVEPCKGLLAIESSEHAVPALRIVDPHQVLQQSFLDFSLRFFLLLGRIFCTAIGLFLVKIILHQIPLVEVISVESVSAHESLQVLLLHERLFVNDVVVPLVPRLVQLLTIHLEATLEAQLFFFARVGVENKLDKALRLVVENSERVLT